MMNLARGAWRMDGARFDGLARLAGRRLERRAAIGAALAALVGGGDAAAKRGGKGGGKAKAVKLGWPCREGADCGKGRRCVRPNADALAGYCKPNGERCGGLTEFCGADRACCGDLQCRMAPGGEPVCLPPAKPLGAKCGDPAECRGGRCARGRCRCHPRLGRCGDECVDRQTDPRHCGACGRACPDGQRCVEGQCVAGGGGGWGWGGNACSFPTDAGFCWGFPFFAAAGAVEMTLKSDLERNGPFCQWKSARFHCPLCAPLGDPARCHPMGNPTWEQAERFCRQLTDTRAYTTHCDAEQCQPGERLCTEKGKDGNRICTSDPSSWCRD